VHPPPHLTRNGALQSLQPWNDVIRFLVLLESIREFLAPC
jgi:hypothetical protein